MRRREPRGLALADDDEQHLLARLAARDPPAFDRLVELYEARVARLAHRLLSWTSDAAEVEDVVQDVFFVAYRKLPMFRRQSSLWTWLTAITLNACRTRRRRSMLWQRWKQWMRPESAVAPPSSRWASDCDDTERVRSAVSHLPAKDQEVVVLFYLQELPVAEIATITGASPGAIDVRLHRARQKLKQSLADLAVEAR